jgi:hypothetical protein
MYILCCAIFILCVFPCFSEENDSYVFTVGKITVFVPNDYFFSCWDGIKNELIKIDNKEEHDYSGITKDFFILYFRKDGDFEDVPDWWGYGVINLPIFTDYVNGVSQIEPNFFTWGMRRNNFKGINICETLTFGRYYSYAKMFEHQIIFTDDEYFYCIRITIGGEKFPDIIVSEMPEYFTNDRCAYYKDWNIDKIPELIHKFNNYQLMPKYINDLFEETNNVFNTIIINE